MRDIHELQLKNIFKLLTRQKRRWDDTTNISNGSFSILTDLNI
jgi:hypothetical protein